MHEGEFVGLVGESGCGKSTMLFAIARLLSPPASITGGSVTFRGDNRADLPRVSAPTLVLQSREDSVAPMTAGLYVRDHVPGCEFEILETRGHCPQLSAPQETATAIRGFLEATLVERTA